MLKPPVKKWLGPLAFIAIILVGLLAPLSPLLTETSSAADEIPVFSKGWSFAFDGTQQNIATSGPAGTGTFNMNLNYDEADKLYAPDEKSIKDLDKAGIKTFLLDDSPGYNINCQVGSIVIVSFKLNKAKDEKEAYQSLNKGGLQDALTSNKISEIKGGPYNAIFCSGTVTPRFLSINVGGKAAPVDPANPVVGGGAKTGWIDYKDDPPLTSDQFTQDRFVFISPFAVVDLKSPLENGSFLRYQAVAGNDPSVKPNGYDINKDNQYLLNSGGAFVLRAVDQSGQFIEKNKAGNCMGFFAMKTGSKGSKYAVPYYVEAHKEGDNCYWTTGSQPRPVKDVSGFQDANNDGYNNLTKNELPSLGGANSRARVMAFASFQWIDAGSIKPMVNDTGATLTNMNIPETATDPNLPTVPKVLSQLPGLESGLGQTGGRWTFWTGSDCKGTYKSLLAIYYRDSNKKLLNTDTGDPANTNTLAYAFTPRGDGNGWSANWDGGNLKCLLGHEIKNNALSGLKTANYISLFNGFKGSGDNQHYPGVVIAFPGNSVGNSDAANTQDLTSQNAQDALNNAANGKQISGPNCDVKLTNPLTWLICPIYAAAQTAVDQFDQAITRLLVIDVKTYFSNPGVEGAWAAMRDIAMGILVLAGLIMVLSQAFDFGPFDAYTVKKILPRIVVAVIVISISYQLLMAAIDLSNGLGVGVRGLLETPFAKTLPNAHIKAGTSTALALVGGGAIIGLGLLGILSFALTALMAVIIGLATLIFRELLILFLIITAPIAIACYVLPNTQKVWKIWYDSFLGALLAFPIIIGFISIGRIFSALTTADPSHEPDLLKQIVALVAYFAPYFLLPTAFKLAGGILSTVAGAANDRSRGPFDRLKKYRQAEGAKNFDKLKSGSRYNENNLVGKHIGRRINRAGLRGGVGVKGRFGAGAVGRYALGNASNFEPEEVAKTNHEFAKRMVDEDTMAAIAFGADARRLGELKHFQKEDGSADTTKINDAIARAKSVGVDRRTQVAAAKQLAKSGKIIADGDEARALVASASGGDKSLGNDLKGALQYTWRGSGRNDIGRDNIADSLKELSTADIGRLKPLGAQGLFGGTTKNPEEKAKAQQRLVEGFSSLGAEEQKAAATVLLGSASSPYLNPDQQANVQAALTALGGNQAVQAAQAEQAKREAARQRAEENNARNPADPPA